MAVVSLVLSHEIRQGETRMIEEVVDELQQFLGCLGAAFHIDGDQILKAWILRLTATLFCGFRRYPVQLDVGW